MTDGPKAFTCERCFSVLGVIVRGNTHRARLDVFAMTLPPSVLLIDRLEAAYKYRVRNLEQGDVLCDLCGATSRWIASERALVELLSRKRKRTFGLEVEGG